METTSPQSLPWESVASYVFRECGRQSFPTIVFINIPEMPGIGRVTLVYGIGKEPRGNLKLFFYFFYPYGKMYENSGKKKKKR